jgi:hypothetical protein
VLAQISQDADRLLGGKPSSCLIIDAALSLPRGMSDFVAREVAGSNRSRNRGQDQARIHEGIHQMRIEDILDRRARSE